MRKGDALDKKESRWKADRQEGMREKDTNKMRKVRRLV